MKPTKLCTACLRILDHTGLKSIFLLWKGTAMAWVEYNPNPDHAKRVGDCAVRAISKALHVDWDKAFVIITITAFSKKDMPSSDAIWGEVLKINGFEKRILPDRCPFCYTAKMFCGEHPKGIYVLAFGGHVATVEDGMLFDSWNSEDEIPIYYWEKV